MCVEVDDGHMELTHFMHSVGSPRGRGSAEQRQTVSVWDARTYAQRQLGERIPHLLRELEFAEVSHFDPMPWLRAILLVSPQPSDALALSVMDRGVVVLEAPREVPAVQVIEQFLQQAGQFQAIATSRARAGSHNPSSPSNPPGHANTESEFSRTPAYFNQALYGEWLGKLSQPWRTEDAFDSES